MQQATPAQRNHALDHLRAALVALVVVHHVAVVYSAVAPFYYVEPPFGDPLGGTVLVCFALFNQAWFMGALFFLAGYFAPGSIDRRGAGDFARARLLRLGLPVVVWIFVLSPLASLAFFLMPAELTGITAPPTLATYPALLGLGPAWFLVLLLVFALACALWRALAGRRPAPKPALPSIPPVWAMVAATAGLALASYLMRIAVPLGREVTVVVDFLDFPTLAYLPQYLGMFVLGVFAFRQNWLERLTGAIGAAGFLAAIAAWGLLFPLAVSGRMFTVAFDEAARFTGNGTWQSAVYALWDSVTVIGLTAGLIVLFGALFAGTGALGRFLARQSYAVYIIHVPLVVYLAWLMRGIDLPALPKFAAVALIALPLSFAAAWLLRKVPWMARVL